MEKLGTHAVFHGRLFSGLALKELPLTGADSKLVTSPASNPAPAVAVAEKPPANIATPQPSVPVNVISFEFKGEKHSAGIDRSAMVSAPSAASAGDLKK